MGSFVNTPRMNPGMPQPEAPLPQNRTNGMQQMMQAMGQLATGAANFHEGMKQHNLKKYQAAVQSIVDGTNPNPDYKQILEWGKKAGLPIKTDVTQDDLQAQKMTKYQQQAEAQQAAVQPFAGMPGALGAMSQPGGLPMPPPPGPPQAQAQPGFMQRMLQGGQRFMGMQGGQPPVDVNSPAGKFLQSLNASRQSQGGLPNDVGNQEELKQLNAELQKATGKLGLQVNSNNMQMTGSFFQKMLQGDPAATQLLFKTGAIKDTPIDAYEAAISLANPQMSLTDVRKQAGQTALYMQTGGPELKAKMFDMAQKMAPSFQNNPMKALSFMSDPTNPQNQPGFSAEDTQKFWEGAGKVLDAYTGVPLNIVGALGTAQVTGNTDTAAKLEDFISKNYPRQNTTTTGLERRRLDQDYTNIVGTLAIRGKEAETGRLSKLIDGAEAIGAIPKEMIEHKDKYTPQQFIDAMRTSAGNNNAMADLLKQNGLAVPSQSVREMGGAERGANIFGPATPTLGPTTPQQPPMMGQQPTPQSPLATPQGQQFQKMLSGMHPQDRVQAITKTHMDPVMQSALLDWTKQQEAVAPAPQALQNQIQPPVQPPINGAGGIMQNMFNMPPQQ